MSQVGERRGYRAPGLGVEVPLPNASDAPGGAQFQTTVSPVVGAPTVRRAALLNPGEAEVVVPKTVIDQQAADAAARAQGAQQVQTWMNTAPVTRDADNNIVRSGANQIFAPDAEGARIVTNDMKTAFLSPARRALRAERIGLLEAEKGRENRLAIARDQGVGAAREAAQGQIGAKKAEAEGVVGAADKTATGGVEQERVKQEGEARTEGVRQKGVLATTETEQKGQTERTGKVVEGQVEVAKIQTKSEEARNFLDNFTRQDVAEVGADALVEQAKQAGLSAKAVAEIEAGAKKYIADLEDKRARDVTGPKAALKARAAIIVQGLQRVGNLENGEGDWVPLTKEEQKAMLANIERAIDAGYTEEQIREAYIKKGIYRQTPPARRTQ
jgi:hypothetical protein